MYQIDIKEAKKCSGVHGTPRAVADQIHRRCRILPLCDYHTHLFGVDVDSHWNRVWRCMKDFCLTKGMYRYNDDSYEPLFHCLPHHTEYLFYESRTKPDEEDFQKVKLTLRDEWVLYEEDQIPKLWYPDVDILDDVSHTTKFYDDDLNWAPLDQPDMNLIIGSDQTFACSMTDPDQIPNDSPTNFAGRKLDKPIEWEKKWGDPDFPDEDKDEVSLLFFPPFFSKRRNKFYLILDKWLACTKWDYSPPSGLATCLMCKQLGVIAKNKGNVPGLFSAEAKLRKPLQLIFKERWVNFPFELQNLVQEYAQEIPYVVACDALVLSRDGRNYHAVLKYKNVDEWWEHDIFCHKDKWICHVCILEHEERMRIRNRVEKLVIHARTEERFIKQ
jgi:hypothetical protein